MSTPVIADDFASVDGLVPDVRRVRTRNPYGPVMIAVSIAATLGILAYAWFLLNPNNRGDILPWAMVIVAGGLGSRLNELTREQPKPMLPVGCLLYTSRCV